ncbi:MAG: FkbM family methyltransferase [bacterium]
MSNLIDILDLENEPNIIPDILDKKFNWNNTPEDFRETINREVFQDKIYEKCFQVEEGDVVFDIGASIGVFTYAILDKKPRHVFCFEPSYTEFKTLILNTRQAPVTCINKAISSKIGVFDSEFVFENDQEKVYSTTFAQVVKDYNIQTIDFLKMDCEGGEYDIFVPENIEWIKANIKKIAGEWHLLSQELKIKFRNFRDSILPNFNNYKIYSLDGVDITIGLWSDEFINFYTEFIIHIDNR